LRTTSPPNGTDAAGTKPGEQATTEEELPEGVTRGKNSSGKPGLFVEDSRWKNIYGNHQLVQKTSELLGEPVTMEALQLRNDAYMAQEQLFTTSRAATRKPRAHSSTIFFDEMKRAKDEGEVGVDASVPMAQTFYSTLREKSPDGYANLRFTAARDLLTEMFTEAAEKRRRQPAPLGPALRTGSGRRRRQRHRRPAGGTNRAIARRSLLHEGRDAGSCKQRGGAADPVEALRQENARLRAERDGSSTTNQAAQRGSGYKRPTEPSQKPFRTTPSNPPWLPSRRNGRSSPSSSSD
jgi:hypothetical protein